MFITEMNNETVPSGTLIVMVGGIATGKTTIAHDIAQQIGQPHSVVETDQIREDLFGDAATQGDPSIIHAIARLKTAALLNNGQTAIYDATNLLERDRRVLVEFAQKLDVTVWVVWVTVEDEIASQRNEARTRTVPQRPFERMCARANQVSQRVLVKEGFAEIVTQDTSEQQWEPSQEATPPAPFVQTIGQATPIRVGSDIIVPFGTLIENGAADVKTTQQLVADGAKNAHDAAQIICSGFEASLMQGDEFREIELAVINVMLNAGTTVLVEKITCASAETARKAGAAIWKITQQPEKTDWRCDRTIVSNAQTNVRAQPTGWNQQNIEGDFDILGDIHGCLHTFNTMLETLGYNEKGEHPQGRMLISVGDIVDRGAHTWQTTTRIMQLVNTGRMFMVKGNHEAKHGRYLAKMVTAAEKRENVQAANETVDRLEESQNAAHGLTLALREAFENGDKDSWQQRSAFMSRQPIHMLLDGGKLLIAHGAASKNMIGRSDKEAEAWFLYGAPTGETTQQGHPVRRAWQQEWDGNSFVVVGHSVVTAPLWDSTGGGSVNIDTGCVTGQQLCALSWSNSTVEKTTLVQADLRDLQ